MDDLLYCSGIDNQATGSILSVRSFRRDFGYYFDGDPVLPAKWQAAFNTVRLPRLLPPQFELKR